MTRIALYARYSSDQQSDASIEDQFRLCRERAEAEGWTVVEAYNDHAVSGASMIGRPEVQKLLNDAIAGQFDLVLAESLDRLSRDQEDIAGIYKRLTFAGVRLVTLSEGAISELHIGLKGTMGALYLKDLADKTRRGLRGRVEAGKSGGGLCYGYDVAKGWDEAGEPVKGDFVVNEAQAAIVRRIFEDFTRGLAPRAIAFALNREGLAGPHGKAWQPTTIYGNWRRGTGILNNELYIGRRIWNRLRYLKDPDTGKRVSRPNPESDWIIKHVPELRIVDQNLWDAVKARQQAVRAPDKPVQVGNKLGRGKRPRHLLSGLVKCGSCGGGFSGVSQTHWGCSRARNTGLCDNRQTIARTRLEAHILDALKAHLMDPALFKEFCDAYTSEINRSRMAKTAALAGLNNELKTVERQIARIITAIKDGMFHPAMKEEMSVLEARKAVLAKQLAEADAPPALLHPRMADDYRRRVTGLHEALAADGIRSEAADILRSLIDKVTVTPQASGNVVELHGDLAGILCLASGQTQKPAAGGGGFSSPATSQVPVVAGAGFEPATFRL